MAVKPELGTQQSQESRHFGRDAEIQAMDGNSPKVQNPNKPTTLKQPLWRNTPESTFSQASASEPFTSESLPIPQRIYQHRNDFVKGFTQRYRIHALVWYEQHENMESAILREKEVKYGSAMPR